MDKYKAEIDIGELLDIIKDGDVTAIDIRNDIERSYGMIPNSTHVSIEELQNNPPSDKTKKYVIYCSRGTASKEIVAELHERGLSNFYSLKGGYSSYVLYIMRHNDENSNLLKKVERYIQTRFRTSLLSNFLKAIKNYKLISENDRIAVCISGGKDSFLMAMLFKELKRWSKINFNVEYISMDPGYNDANRKLIEENAQVDTLISYKLKGVKHSFLENF